MLPELDVNFDPDKKGEIGTLAHEWLKVLRMKELGKINIKIDGKSRNLETLASAAKASIRC